VDVSGYNVDPSKHYDGPEFDEYCIAEGKYLPASRDRAPCATCALGDLCQAGFEEQVRRVMAGENPSLTECKIFAPESLMSESLLRGLSEEATEFVKEKVFNLAGGGDP
jgi:hypothetical protein